MTSMGMMSSGFAPPGAEYLIDRYGKQAIDDAMTYALADYNSSEDGPVECCGFISKSGQFVPVVNSSVHPAGLSDSFAFAADTWADVRDQAACIFHTHIRDDQPATLSRADIESARAIGLPSIMLHTEMWALDYWDPNHWHPWPLSAPKSPMDLRAYQRWFFEYGRSDCGALLRGFYRAEFDIVLPDFPRGQIRELLDRSFNPFVDHHKERGFVPIQHRNTGLDFAELRKGDVLVVPIGDNPNPSHCLIVADAFRGAALHHPGPGQESELVFYHDWLTRTELVLRHEALGGFDAATERAMP